MRLDNLTSLHINVVNFLKLHLTTDLYKSYNYKTCRNNRSSL